MPLISSTFVSFPSLLWNETLLLFDGWFPAAVASGNRPQEEHRQAALLRDILDNPFRPAALDPFWLASTVTALTQGMSDSQDLATMPILADALQALDAIVNVLDHCRGPGPHVRGCWVVGLVLGKKLASRRLRRVLNRLG